MPASNGVSHVTSSEQLHGTSSDPQQQQQQQPHGTEVQPAGIPAAWRSGTEYTVVLFYRYARLDRPLGAAEAETDVARGNAPAVTGGDVAALTAVTALVEAVRERCRQLGLAGRVLLAGEIMSGLTLIHTIVHTWAWAMGLAGRDLLVSEMMSGLALIHTSVHTWVFPGGCRFPVRCRVLPSYSQHGMPLLLSKGDTIS